ncbi:hypothetical protein [Wenzhouxiangella sp. AB-CW3]|nr:hypothetical protein [Wenzhouxiangella sp. AB-CW3]
MAASDALIRALIEALNVIYIRAGLITMKKIDIAALEAAARGD